MADRNLKELAVTEHIFEVRHQASGTFLDVRGKVADYVVYEKKLFPHWRIETNVVHFFDASNHIEKYGGFAGYKNSGFLSYDPDTTNFFQDKAGSFWRNLTKNPHYEIPELTRLGTRTKIFIPLNESFDEINNLLFRALYTESTSTLLGGVPKDQQLSWDLIEGSFDCRLVLGPIHKGEAARYFSFDDAKKFDAAGVFFDLDYYQTKELSAERVPVLLSQAMDSTWAKLRKVLTSLGLLDGAENK